MLHNEISFWAWAEVKRLSCVINVKKGETRFISLPRKKKTLVQVFAVQKLMSGKMSHLITVLR